MRFTTIIGGLDLTLYSLPPFSPLSLCLSLGWTTTPVSSSNNAGLPAEATVMAQRERERSTVTGAGASHESAGAAPAAAGHVGSNGRAAVRRSHPPRGGGRFDRALPPPAELTPA